MNNEEFILRVLKVMQGCDSRDDLWWQVNDDSSVIFTIQCSDIFYWGCADSEDVTPDNIEQLEQALIDTKQLIDPTNNIDELMLFCVPMLFAARMRKLRPQGAAYSFIRSKMWKLFDDCGPERDVTVGNTPKPNFEKHCAKEIEWDTKRPPSVNPIVEETKLNFTQRLFAWICKKIEVEKCNE